MAGLPAARRIGLFALGTALALGVGRPAAAFEFFDGRLQLHGFYEQQIRTLGNDFSLSDDLDLVQWYHVLNLEVEYDVAPDGWGPFDLISTFARIEARYDCVWTRGCGMLRSTNSYGNRTEHLPKRLIGAQQEGFTATVDDIDIRPYAGTPLASPEETNFYAPSIPGAAPSQVDTSGTGIPDGFFADGYLNKSGLSRVFAVNAAPNASLEDQGLAPYPHRRRPVDFFGIPGIQTLFQSRGPDTFFGTEDDAARFIFSPFQDCIFALRSIKGEKAGRSRQILGPWNPGCKIRNQGSIRTKPNPFNALDVNPLLKASGLIPKDPNDPTFDPNLNDPDPSVPGLTLGANLLDPQQEALLVPQAFDAPSSNVGSTSLPFKPAPEHPIDPAVDLDFDGLPDKDVNGDGLPDPVPAHESQGIFYPNATLRRLIRDSEFGAFDQNFRQAELEWNRGASQQDEKELKEFYADIELLDSRLWLRLGKQNIVWGKTELFRTTDQFNPQDLALATLPSLEESRIALWALRAVYSFYEVGPLEDVRLELAFNYDQFEPADLGRCGEPFTPNPVCNKTVGLFAHGFTGFGLAGEIRPEDPWNDASGLEYGGRLEWRWGRFSFQLSDFYGYNDFPDQQRLFNYERNVDPESGRPRRAFARGECDSPGDPSCLGFVSSPASPSGNWFTDLDNDGLPDRAPVPGTDLVPVTVPAEHTADVVVNTPVNQQLYAMICSTSIGFSPALDATVCAQSVLGSQNFVPPFRLVQLIGGILSGSPAVALALPAALTAGIPVPLVQLNNDPNDDPLGIDGGALAPGVPGIANQAAGQVFTTEQEALLGCGPFYGSDCDDDGADLLNAEASSLIQSWPGYDGTTGLWRMDFGDPALAAAQAQPGTVDFQGGSPCLRFEGGTVFILPGCRGPFYDASTLTGPGGPFEGLNLTVMGDYDPLVDGCVDAISDPACALSNGGAGGRTLAIPNIDVDGDGNPDFGPSTGQQFVSEVAAGSWNALMGFVALSSIPDSVNNTTGRPNPSNPDGSSGGDGLADRPPLFDEFDSFNAPNGPGLVPGDPGYDPTTMGPLRLNGCSYLRPQFCSNVSAIFSVTGHQRNSIRAGGNGRFGRQDWVWNGGGSIALRYERRNVLGFALDFAEDVTKSNWGAELTWIEGLRFSDNDEMDGSSRADTYNLTVSVDRPTFINFLNPNRTFFFNSQWFFQYIDGYTKNFTNNGPFNVLATFTILTGYSQDRLLPSVTFVYDKRSNSGGALPQITYRFTENFSASVGGNLFWGRWETRDMPIAPLSLTNRVGRGAYKSFQENGLSVVRDREEVYLRIRYTF